MTKQIQLFILFILLQRGLCSVKDTYWRRVFLSPLSLEDPSVESSNVSSSSDLTCSIVATKTEGTNLFCFKDGICRLSNLTLVPSYHNVTGEGLLDCSTKIPELCPNTFKKIGNKCYNIGTVRKIFDVAKQDCLDQGAILAQPDMTAEALESLVTGLELHYPTELQSMTAEFYQWDEWMWLGLIEEGSVGNYKYLNREGTLQDDSPLIEAQKDSTQEAITLVTTGVNKYSLDTPRDLLTDRRYYICETPIIYWNY